MRTEQVVGALALIGATASLNAGCVAHVGASGQAEAEAPVVFVQPPTLVAVGSGVWVVRDYDQAVYYVDDYYWVNRDNAWHRARSYDSGWAVVDVTAVPATIVHRDHHLYVRYHGTSAAQTRPAPRDDAAPGPGPAEPHGGPPDHAAEQHGGPPGQRETPGLGNERRAEEAHHGGPPSHDDMPGQAGAPTDRADKDKADKDKKHDEKDKADKDKADKDKGRDDKDKADKDKKHDEKDKADKDKRRDDKDKADKDKADKDKADKDKADKDKRRDDKDKADKDKADKKK